jgi:transglutaminase-like putative cysteine protease
MMQLQLETSDRDAYLATSEVIDFEQAAIRAIATQLSQSASTDGGQAQCIYEFVRDEIPHSFDIKGRVVTCKASEVLQHREGICFAKSHLLAALLRCVGIPTGFCYQRLLLEQENAPEFTLHGLNAIYLTSVDRWMRVDARGNKPGVQAEFDVAQERLAFPIRPELHESEYAVVYAQPNAKVIAALSNNLTLSALIQQLPDQL